MLLTCLYMITWFAFNCLWTDSYFVKGNGVHGVDSAEIHTILCGGLIIGHT